MQTLIVAKTRVFSSVRSCNFTLIREIFTATEAMQDMFLSGNNISRQVAQRIALCESLSFEGETSDLRNSSQTLEKCSVDSFA